VGYRAKFALEHKVSFVVGLRVRFAVAQGHRRGPGMNSLKSPCKTYHWSSTETIALNCLVLRKSYFCPN